MPSDPKTRDRMEDVVADRGISRDSSSANQVDPNQMCLTSFGDDFTGPPTLPCSRDDALVDNGAVAPKPCLSPVEMRTRTAAAGLLHAGTASTTMKTIFPRPLFLEASSERPRNVPAAHQFNTPRTTAVSGS